LIANILRKKSLPVLDFAAVANLTFPKARFPFGDFFSREQAISECDWVVMSSMFVAQPIKLLFSLFHELIRLVENRLNI
jgi:hypothetical protein